MWLAHGLRKGEANHLRPEDIKVDDGYLDICIHRDSKGKIVWQPKFGIERKVPIVETTLPVMRAVRELPTDRRGHVLGVHDRRKALARAIGTTKVEGRVRFHDFRHTAYTRLKDALFDHLDPELGLKDVSLIFGHGGDKSMDRVYDHRTVERLRKTMALMPLAKVVAAVLEADDGE